MKRSTWGVFLLVLAALCVTAPWATGAPIRVGEPYRGTALDLHEEPAMSLVPATKVYYVRDRECDLYRFGRFWYFLDDDLWFRSRSWQGPFIHLQASSVPRSVRTVPLNYRRHWPGPQPRAMIQDGYRKPTKVK